MDAIYFVCCKHFQAYVPRVLHDLYKCSLLVCWYGSVGNQLN